jgi:hypothetical protein
LQTDQAPQSDGSQTSQIDGLAAAVPVFLLNATPAALVHVPHFAADEGSCPYRFIWKIGRRLKTYPKSLVSDHPVGWHSRGSFRPRRLRDRDNQRLLEGVGRQHDRQRVLNFLTNPEVEPTNSRAERPLRPAVIDRKVSDCSRLSVEPKHLRHFTGSIASLGLLMVRIALPCQQSSENVVF